MKSLTGDRAYALTTLMIADKARAKKFMKLSPDKAREEINALGYNYSIEEITDYSDALRPVILGLNLPKNTSLENVSGGANNTDCQEFALDFAIDMETVRKINWN